jgi:hypothetical protein
MIHKVFVDMDEVMVDFCGAYEVLHNCDLGEKFGWQLPHGLDDCDAEFFHTAPKMHWCDDLMDVVKEFPTYIITDAGNNPHKVAGKVAWMHTHYPEFVDRMIFTAHKHLMAAPDRLLIDDKPENTHTWIHHGGYAITPPAIWSTGLESVEQYDIVEAVQSIVRHSSIVRYSYRD